MKKPYINSQERFDMMQDTLLGDCIRLDYAYKMSLRDSYRKYGIFGKPILHLWMKRNILNPINKHMKYNWKKSNGRHV
jgi:hypothetical protein